VVLKKRAQRDEDKDVRSRGGGFAGHEVVHERVQRLIKASPISSSCKSLENWRSVDSALAAWEIA
jgi:hypothetical protein